MELESLRSLCGELREYLEGRIGLLNEEIRTYPRPIARCDEQLAKLLDQRTRLREPLQRMIEFADRDLSGAECRAAIDAFMNLPAASDDEDGEKIRSHLKAALQD
jgi:hypothetical protein